MAPGIAAKRSRKALRRKQMVERKRKLAPVESTPAMQARQAAGAPLRCCLMHGHLDGWAKTDLTT